MTPLKRMSLIPLLLISLLTFGLTTAHANAEEVAETPVAMSAVDRFEKSINDLMGPVTNAVAGAVLYQIWVGDLGEDGECSAEESCFGVRWIVLWLGVGALFFTFYLKFINLRGFRHAIDLVRGKYSDPNNPGEVTHFQALATALSGTVGLGNIAGVAIAISMGGPGATFWMILAGFLGMSSKFAECTLGVMYRNEYADGHVSGGPMHYLSKGLAEKNLTVLGQFLAVFFSVCCIGAALGAGNMFQSNQAFSMLAKVAGEDSTIASMPSIFGFIMAVMVGIVILGGIRSIAKVTEKLVPLMASLYLLGALFIIISHADQIPSAFGAIFTGAFSAEGVIGGAMGALIAGLQRAAFSNEAGIGSASIAHSCVKTDKPVTEGFVALLEPLIDTIVICTLTALVIVITGVYQDQTGISGVELTAQAFTSVIPWFDWVLLIAVILFAYSTLLCWAFYASKCWMFLFGENKRADRAFKLVFCGFIVVGAVMSLDNVIGFSDAMFFLMGLANMTGLYILAPKIKQALNEYWQQLQSGEIKPHK